MTTEIITSLFWLEESSRTLNMGCLKNMTQFYPQSKNKKIKNEKKKKKREALPSPPK